ncbi:MAG: hypothetical protein CMF66_09285 [Magnetovibrio sp.]|nr:hypothetical protein [Magnetovibrio sp.]
MVFGVFLWSPPLSISAYAAKPLIKCRTVSGVVEVPSVEACQNWAMGTPLPKSYGDFDGVWAGKIQCENPDLGPTNRDIAIEIIGEEVSLHGYEDHTLGDLAIYEGKVELEGGLFSNKGEILISGVSGTYGGEAGAGISVNKKNFQSNR